VNFYKELQLCPICSWGFKNGQYRTVSYPTEADKSENKPNLIAFCENCGVGVAVPAWSIGEVENFYSSGDYWGNSRAEMLSAKKYPVPYALARSRWKLVEPWVRRAGEKISLLDIGGGHGFLGMTAAKSKDLRLSTYVCVEKDRTLRESLKKTWSVYFPKSNLQVIDRIDHVDGQFDCIILSHILEHLIDPQKMLHAVLKKLKKGGVLFVDVPNQDYLFKKDVFPHFLFFNISSLRHLLQACGLTISLIDCYGNDMNRSPMNFKNSSKIRSLFVEIMMRTKVVIPKNIILAFFTRYFEMDDKNSNGIWIRAIGMYCSASA
jgi:SAM-dependent methyltransferase